MIARATPCAGSGTWRGLVAKTLVAKDWQLLNYGVMRPEVPDSLGTAYRRMPPAVEAMASFLPILRYRNSVAITHRVTVACLMIYGPS